MDPEQLLGSLIFGGLGRRVPGGAKAAIGMGLLGVAIAAIEQLSQQSQTRATPPPPPPGSGATPPPPPPPAPPVATGAPEVSLDARHDDAMLLIRAMAAAAWADGRLDDGERARILERAQRGGLAAHASAAVEEAMAHPPTATELAAAVTRPEQAEQVYAAAVLALDVETDAEHAFLAELATRLGLEPATVNRIHEILGS